MALDRRDEVEEAVRQIRAISPDNYIGKLGLLDYALAYGRADEARAALAEVETRWPKDAAFAQTLLPWALGEPGVDPGNLRAAIADAPPGEASSYFIARQDVDGYNAYIETLRSDTPGRTTSPIFTAAGRWATRCCAIRGSRRCWCATASRPIGARKAGPPDAGRWARRISSAAPMPLRCLEMSFLTELKRRNVIRMAGLYLVGAWLLVQVAGTLLPVFDAPAWVHENARRPARGRSRACADFFLGV